MDGDGGGVGGAEHANASFLAAFRRRRLRRGDGMMGGGGGGGGGGGWRGGGRGGAVLPVAVGHGILSLLLLEELCDGQQLFQYMLQERNKTNQTEAAFRQYYYYYYYFLPLTFTNVFFSVFNVVCFCVNVTSTYFLFFLFVLFMSIFKHIEFTLAV